MYCTSARNPGCSCCTLGRAWVLAVVHVVLTGNDLDRLCFASEGDAKHSMDYAGMMWAIALWNIPAYPSSRHRISDKWMVHWLRSIFLAQSNVLSSYSYWNCMKLGTHPHWHWHAQSCSHLVAYIPLYSLYIPVVSQLYPVHPLNAWFNHIFIPLYYIPIKWVRQWNSIVHWLDSHLWWCNHPLLNCFLTIFSGWIHMSTS